MIKEYNDKSLHDEKNKFCVDIKRFQSPLLINTAQDFYNKEFKNVSKRKY